MSKNNRMITSENRLTQRDIELIERVIYKTSDDVAVSIARSFERLEERVDAAESRIYSRLADGEDKMESVRQELADELGDIKGEVRELARGENDKDELPDTKEEHEHDTDKIIKK
jgi:hypothetical protein